MTAGGISGAILQMVSHGVSTGALFILVGVIYDRRHTRDLAEFGGLAKVMPVYATLFVIVAMSSVGLPGTNGFVGEFMILRRHLRLRGTSQHWPTHLRRSSRRRRDPRRGLHAARGAQDSSGARSTTTKNENLTDLSLREGSPSRRSCSWSSGSASSRAPSSSRWSPRWSNFISTFRRKLMLENQDDTARLLPSPGGPGPEEAAEATARSYQKARRRRSGAAQEPGWAGAEATRRAGGAQPGLRQVIVVDDGGEG